LTCRNTINADERKPIKSDDDQHRDITRAIFFYRLSPDSSYHFHRYHDPHRRNVAVFVALLAIRHSDPPMTQSRGLRFPEPARRFCIAYLVAVLENHNNPYVFRDREAFIKLWKSSSYDFFEFNSGQKKLLKAAMKLLNVAWEKELDRLKRFMSAAEYEAKVAKFVGVLVPGREDQRSVQLRVPDTDVKMELEHHGFPPGT
jgi:hypothetical protein